MVIPNAPMQFISLDIAYMPRDEAGYRYILLIGDLFSKYVQAVPLRDQTAPSILRAFSSHWLYIHGVPSFLLSDQGSNVDGNVIREFCDESSITKRRASPYHSQGNGTAERDIRSIKEMLRAVLLQRNFPQTKWRRLLPGLVFALNCSVSNATKCTPYKIVFGRSATLPIDLLFSSGPTNSHTTVTPKQYEEEYGLLLQDIFENVTKYLVISKEKMAKEYNKNIRFHDYKEGEKVWLKKKHFKTGENMKLAPKRTGTWSVLRKLANGVNFEIINDSTKERKLVHHDRLKLVKGNEISRKITQTLVTGNEYLSSSSTTSSSTTSYYPPGNGLSDSDTDTNEEVSPRTYPTRIRTQRQLPGTLPCNAIRL